MDQDRRVTLTYTTVGTDRWAWLRYAFGHLSELSLGMQCKYIGFVVMEGMLFAFWVFLVLSSWADHGTMPGRPLGFCLVLLAVCIPIALIPTKHSVTIGTFQIFHERGFFLTGWGASRIRWVDTRAVINEPTHIFVVSNTDAISIPKQAFRDSAEEQRILELILFYWQQATGTVLPPGIQDDPTVWPPPPRISN